MKRLVMKRTFAIMLAALMFATILPFVSMNGANAAETSSTLGVTYHTKEEVQAYLSSSGAALNDQVTYGIEPNVTTTPYSVNSLGSLSQTTTDQAIKIINQVRYIAGIGEVTNDTNYAQLAQAASFINYAIEGVTKTPALTHTPSVDGRTAAELNMDDALFTLGDTGAGSTNLAWSNYGQTINDTIVSSWMYDGDTSNISRLGHRRWILNPVMGKTGFGMVGNYNAMYAFDTSNAAASQTGVAWPAQTMPVEYFGSDYPWSISMGEAVASASVTLTRRSDGTVWNFSATDASGGDFYINNDGYGQLGAIIWRPTGITAYNDGDIFDVVVTASGTAGTVLNQTYSVEFISATSTNNKLTPEYVVPTGLTAYVGQTLADIVLPTAENGTWEWEFPLLSVSNIAGVYTVYAKFIPNDTETYEIVTNIPVVVTVLAADETYSENSTYAFLEGENGAVVNGGANDYTIRVNGDFTKFTGVEIDGVSVDPANYIASSGSTIITFRADYLNTLAVGKHTVTVNYTDGSVATTLTIQGATQVTTNTTTQNGTAGLYSPKTGDTTSFILLFVLLSVSGVGVLAFVGKRKAKK